ncbi:MAG: stalk domain-containing protein [Firmicutes bacterium]|nr:stalk domain-containing protein [Bacillota bacterium]
MKKHLSLFIALTIVFGLVSGLSMVVSADGDHQWVLVETHYFPIPPENNEESSGLWNCKSSMGNNTAELESIINDPYDKTNYSNLHAIYRWSDLPQVIQPNGRLVVKVEQEAIKRIFGNRTDSLYPYMKSDAPDLELGYGTAISEDAKIILPNGVEEEYARFGYGGHELLQSNGTFDMVIEDFGKGYTENQRKGVYVGFWGVKKLMGVRYVYEWQEKSNTTNQFPQETIINIVSTQPTTPVSTDTGAEAFESGARLMWPSVQNILGYRLYRSKNQGQLGISVTDFYITSTSYADVNVEPNTTYYYSVKTVLAEANPYQGIEEKLGDVIATFVITTGNEIYKPGYFKHFIMLKLDSPYMSIDGVEEEVDPGRGTAPIVIAGRTMVPIRAVVQAMGGTVGWDGATSLITLEARGNKVEMWLGKTDIKVNGVAREMDIAPVAKDGRTYVPVRFAAENLNCKVDWINSTKEAIIVYEE